LIYFGSLMERAPQSKQTLLSLLESDLTEGTTKFFDLHMIDEQVSAAAITEALNYADIVKLNERALRFVIANCCQLASSLDSKLSTDIAGLQIACELLMGQFFMQAVIVTLEGGSYFYFDADSQTLSNLSNDEVQLATMSAVGATDAATAADAFSAFFIHGWNQNWRMQKTLAAAHEFATALVNLADATSERSAFYQTWRGHVAG
jgi:sugar/nucleoside kinase (ribokinase family)